MDDVELVVPLVEVVSVVELAEIDVVDELLVDELLVDVDDVLVVVLVKVVVVILVIPGMQGIKVPQIDGHPGGGSSCKSTTSFESSLATP